jgi:exportin-T
VRCIHNRLSSHVDDGHPVLRNKFSHTLSLFFLRTYVDQWPTFFTDFFTLISPSESSSSSSFNPHVSLLLFHLILEISGEVADQMLKAARIHNPARHARDGRVRDAVRERDAAGINEAVLTIIAANVEKLGKLRSASGSAGSRKELEQAEEVVDWGIRTFGSYVGWVDINLTVTPTTVPLLFTLISDAALPIRLATCVSLSRIVSKGLKEPGDKLQLIKVLSLADVLATLEERTRKEQIARGEDTDEGEESYREALGKLLNVLGLELCKLSDVRVVSTSSCLEDTSQDICRTLKMRFERRQRILPTRPSRRCCDSWLTRTTIRRPLCSLSYQPCFLL